MEFASEDYVIFVIVRPKVLNCVWDGTTDKNEERELNDFKSNEEG